MKGVVRAGLSGAATWEQRPEGSEEAVQRANRSGLQPEAASAQALPCGLVGEFCKSADWCCCKPSLRRKDTSPERRWGQMG